MEEPGPSATPPPPSATPPPPLTSLGEHDAGAPKTQPAKPNAALIARLQTIPTQPYVARSMPALGKMLHPEIGLAGSPANLNFRMQFIREKGEALPAAPAAAPPAAPVVRGLPSRKFVVAPRAALPADPRLGRLVTRSRFKVSKAEPAPLQPRHGRASAPPAPPQRALPRPPADEELAELHRNSTRARALLPEAAAPPPAPPAAGGAAADAPPATPPPAGPPPPPAAPAPPPAALLLEMLEAQLALLDRENASLAQQNGSLRQLLAACAAPPDAPPPPPGPVVPLDVLLGAHAYAHAACSHPAPAPSSPSTLDHGSQHPSAVTSRRGSACGFDESADAAPVAAGFDGRMRAASVPISDPLYLVGSTS